MKAVNIVLFFTVVLLGLSSVTYGLNKKENEAVREPKEPKEPTNKSPIKKSAIIKVCKEKPAGPVLVGSIEKPICTQSPCENSDTQQCPDRS